MIDPVKFPLLSDCPMLSHVIPCHILILGISKSSSRVSHHFQLLPRSHVAQGSTEGVERETEEEVEKGAIDWSLWTMICWENFDDMLGK